MAPVVTARAAPRTISACRNIHNITGRIETSSSTYSTHISLTRAAPERREGIWLRVTSTDAIATQHAPRRMRKSPTGSVEDVATKRRRRTRQPTVCSEEATSSIAALLQQHIRCRREWEQEDSKEATRSGIISAVAGRWAVGGEVAAAVRTVDAASAAEVLRECANKVGGVAAVGGCRARRLCRGRTSAFAALQQSDAAAEARATRRRCVHRRMSVASRSAKCDGATVTRSARLRNPRATRRGRSAAAMTRAVLFGLVGGRSVIHDEAPGEIAGAHHGVLWVCAGARGAERCAARAPGAKGDGDAAHAWAGRPSGAGLAAKRNAERRRRSAAAWRPRPVAEGSIGRACCACTRGMRWRRGAHRRRATSASSDARARGLAKPQSDIESRRRGGRMASIVMPRRAVAEAAPQLGGARGATPPSRWCSTSATSRSTCRRPSPTAASPPWRGAAGRASTRTASRARAARRRRRPPGRRRRRRPGRTRRGACATSRASRRGRHTAA